MLIDPWPNSDKPPLVSPAPVLQITLRPFKNTPAGYRCSLLTAAATGTTRSTSNLTQSAMGTLDDRFPLNSKLKLPQLVCSAQLHELSYTVKLAAFISRPAVENYDDGLAQSSPLLFLRKALDRETNRICSQSEELLDKLDQRFASLYRRLDSLLVSTSTPSVSKQSLPVAPSPIIDKRYRARAFMSSYERMISGTNAHGIHWREEVDEKGGGIVQLIRNDNDWKSTLQQLFDDYYNHLEELADTSSRHAAVQDLVQLDQDIFVLSAYIAYSHVQLEKFHQIYQSLASMPYYQRRQVNDSRNHHQGKDDQPLFGYPQLQKVHEKRIAFSTRFRYKLQHLVPIIEDYQCVVCLDIIYKPVVITLCGHSFCAHCLATCFRNRPSLHHINDSPYISHCPLCRSSFRINSSRDIKFDDAKANFLRFYFPKEWRERRHAEWAREIREWFAELDEGNRRFARHVKFHCNKIMNWGQSVSPSSMWKQIRRKRSIDRD